MNTPSRGPQHNEGVDTCQGKPCPPNLARRVKRRAWAPEWNWFAVCAPGLEAPLFQEMRALGLEPLPAEPDGGGVGFRGKLEAGYLANLWLRCCARVLLRLADFRVRTWDDLVRQARGVPWEAFLPAGAPLRIKVSLKGSNLKHSGRVAEEVLAAAAQSLTKLGLAPPILAASQEPAQAIMVRGLDRRCQISLDASGEHLHKRGYRLAAGKAPLREDLAAALVTLAGYDGSQPFLDPMCGAGTLAIEAALLSRGLPALGEERDLSMLAWPCHREPTWRHLREKAREQALGAAPQPILARDAQTSAIRATAANAQRAGVAADLVIAKADFFQTPAPPGPPGLLAMNPPYGKRLGSVRQAGEFAQRLGAHLANHYPGWRVAAVLYLPQWLEVLGLRDARTLAAPFGGLKVTLAVGEVKG